jgi:O-antigen ligase
VSTRWLQVMLVLWAVGVQTLEPLALAGMAGCAVGLVVPALRRADRGQAAFAMLRGWWPLWLFVGWASLAPFLAGRAPSGAGLSRLVEWLGIPVAALTIAHLGRKAVAAAWIGGGVLVLSSVVAGLQHYGVWPGLESFSPLGFTRIPFHRVYEAVPGAEGRFMAGGLLFHRLKFAHVGGLAVLALLAVGFHTRGAERRWSLVAAVAGLVAILVFPYARAGSVALLASCALVMLLGSRQRRWAALAGGALVVTGLLVSAGSPGVRARFATSLSAEGSGERHELLWAGLRAVQAHPWVGLGAGRFRVGEWAADSAGEHVRTHAGKAHNQFLSVAAESGIPGLVFFVLVLAWLGRRLELVTATGMVGVGALIFFALLSLLHDPLFHGPFSMALALVLGAGVSRGAPSPESSAAAGEGASTAPVVSAS